MWLSRVIHAGSEIVIASVVALVVLLFLTARSERRSILVKTGLFVLCLVGLLIAALLKHQGLGDAADVVRGLSILGEGICVISLAGTALFRVVMPRLGLIQPRILQDVVVALTSVIWSFLWLRLHGVDPTGIVATSAVVTAVLGLSLQDTLGNLLGGMAIQFDESIRVGDWVKVEDLVGRVVEVRWRYTAIETRNWETVIFPNSVLVKNKFVVLGRRQGEPMRLRRWIWFNVDYRFHPARVIETATQAVKSAEIANVAPSPEPNCVVMEFAESVARYALRYWLTDLLADDSTDSEVRKHLFVALERAGLSLAIPAQAVFLTKQSRKRKAAKADEAILRRTQALSHVDLFRELTPEERTHLAERLVPTPFAQGDIMTQQGAEAHWLYFLVEGQAEVVIGDGKGHSRKVAILEPGSVFGEMGMMTGEPRRASVIAKTEAQCYRLDKEAFREIIQMRPALADNISHLLAKRRAEYDAALQNLDAETRAVHISRDRQDILAKIRAFFGLDGTAVMADKR
jgi:small-conductance mechanosensitive channel/CRP-like cAMP-binding protein